MTTGRASRIPDEARGEPASVGELNGIEPASESRLHQAGVYTWFALADVLDAIDALRATADDRLRELSEQVAARASAAEGTPTAPRSSGGQRTESFIVRISLTGDGQPTHSVVAHVRTQTELPLPGWSAGEATRFIAEHAGVQQPSAVSSGAALAETPAAVVPDAAVVESAPPDVPAEQSAPPAASPSSQEHVVVLDAGKTYGGLRNLTFTVSTARATDIGEFTYRAVLASRRYGEATGVDGWATWAELAGRAHAPGPLPLSFEAVDLPTGVHRLRLRLTLRLNEPRPQDPPLPLTLEEPAVTGAAAAGRRS